MSITVMIEFSINDDQPHAMAKYLEVASVLLRRVGAKMIKRVRLPDNEDGAPAKWVVSINFPHREAVDGVFNSVDYQEIIPLRDLAFSRYQFSVLS